MIAGMRMRCVACRSPSAGGRGDDGTVPVRLRNLFMVGMLLCAGFVLLLAASGPYGPVAMTRSSTSALPGEGPGVGVARAAIQPGAPDRRSVPLSVKAGGLVNGPGAGSGMVLAVPVSEVGSSGPALNAASPRGDSSGGGLLVGLALPVAMLGIFAAATARTRRRYSTVVNRLNETAETYYCIGGRARSRLILTAEPDGPAVYRLEGETLDRVGKWTWGNLSLSKKGYTFSAANTPNGLHLETLNGDNAMTVVMFPSSARLIAQPLRGELNDLLRRWNDAIATVRSRETVDGQDESWPSAP